MSTQTQNQPSTLTSLQSSASNAASTVSDAVKPADPKYDADADAANFTKDVHGNTMKKGDYKDQLTEAAGAGSGKNKEEGVVEKVLKYIPGADKMLDSGGRQEEEKEPGPPERPDHDVQVEQFLRKQYHSRSGDGMPDPDKD